MQLKVGLTFQGMGLITMEIKNLLLRLQYIYNKEKVSS
ncbi:hypothetical protein Dbac_1524 [Desulfomicrobium baculatum DSM 4028]|uniref:Uncharacterized protein n=1 Tax=Desulfomicrobium baculatum (strain DSM 4028 / VKM B-1378 / X) TaxID=525897 RepID=C7LTZ4_DESBD|nr:hypothetical protein Dbac_1524 [Desulfomicrobium baculatum DSM 4028]